MTPKEMLAAFFALVIGLLVGRAWECHLWIKARERKRRTDEAARFAPGDKVTFGDGSYVVVRSSEAPGVAP